MKFTGSTSLSREQLRADFDQARSLGQVRLGEHCVYFQKFSGTYALPSGRIFRAWVRQEEVRANLCCGRANFDQFYLMVQEEGGAVCRGQVLSKETGRACLDRIRAENPGTLIAPPDRL